MEDMSIYYNNGLLVWGTVGAILLLVVPGLIALGDDWLHRYEGGFRFKTLIHSKHLRYPHYLAN
jgi:hypothetical protein